MTAGSGWDAAMRLALAEAVAALDTGDVPVGAVVLAPPSTPSAGWSPAVLAAARNEREARGDPTAHAELLAVQRAAEAIGSWRLDGVTMVVTVEPCPMCAGALSLARVPRLVYGAADPKGGAVGSLWDLMRDPRAAFRAEVISGVLAAECGELLRAFFRGQRGVR